MEKQSSDSIALRQAFYRSFDRSFIEEQCLSLLTKNTIPKSFRLLGEGRHFVAWKTSTALSQDDLVVRVPVLNEEQDTPEFRSWLRAMKVVSKLQIPLIPPFEIMQIKSITILVSPLGNLQYSDLASHWKPMEMQVSKLQNYLQSLGLKIDDFVQLAYWRNIPFIYDLSDLQFA